MLILYLKVRNKTCYIQIYTDLLIYDSCFTKLYIVWGNLYKLPLFTCHILSPNDLVKE